MSAFQKKAQMEAYILSTLDNMQKLIYTDQTGTILNAVQNKDIVIFLGNTRCGKSTVVNHVIGNKLKATLVRKNTYNIVLNNSSDDGPIIGIESVSETTIPTSWHSNKINGLVVDAPGFDDNRGEAQDVANAFYIKELITNASSVKFVLICDINDILHHNIGQFVTFIDRIYAMLPQNCILPGVCIVFTKDKHENLSDDIVDILKEKIVHQPKMKVENRQLIDHLVKNKYKIVVTNMPQNAGLIDEKDVFQNMIDTIESKTQNLPRDTLSSIIPGISDKSKCFLLEAHTHFTELEAFNQLLIKLQQEFDQKVKGFDSENSNEFKQKLDQVEQFLMSLKKMQNLQEILHKMQEFLPNMDELKPENEIYTKLKFVEFVDSILEIQESSVFLVKINSVIANMIDILCRKRISFQEKTMEITQQEAMKKFQELKEDNDKKQGEMQKRIDGLIESNENARKQMKKKFNLFSMLGEALDSIVGVITTFKSLK